MPAAAQLRPALRKLALDPASASNRRLWRAMSAEEREHALLAEIRKGADPSQPRRGMIGAIVRGRNFRRETLERWTDEKLAAWSCKQPDTLDVDLAWSAIIALHMVDRAPMLAEFLDALGIPNEEGVIRDEPPHDAISADTLAAAATGLLERHAADDVVLYLLAMRTNYRDAFQHLDEWLTAFAADEQEGEQSVPEPVEPATSPVEELAPAPLQLPVDPMGFTTLDRRLVLTVVDAAAGVIGAATPEEIDDLLLELEQLSARRHATFFHGGFRDALFDRGPAGALPAENETRRRWYWAGFINGLARRERWDEIAALFDAHAPVRALGGHDDGPAFSASPLVFRALTEAERFGEAAAFVKPPSASISPGLRHAMLATAVRLIHGFRAADARPLLDTLWLTLRGRTGDFDEPELRFFEEVQRRRALCLRQLDEAQDALVILRTLTSVPDPTIRAIAHTDIGLIQAGYRRLGDITLPAAKQDLHDLVEALGRGEEELRIAAATKGFRPAHANFALGVLAMAREKYAEADHRLGGALAYFSGRPEVYRADGTLGLAQLYQGVCICLGLEDAGRLPRARELMLAGLNAGAKLPAWLVRSTVDALALVRADLATDTASVILALCGDAVLDELAASEAARDCTAVRLALFARAASPSRATAARARDYRTVLPWLLRAQEIDKARDALDFLEQSAGDGVGRAELLGLLCCPDELSPAWDRDRVADARVRCLEAEGRYVEAAAEIEAILPRLLASTDPTALDDADLLLDVLEGYGPAGADALARLGPVVEARVARREAEAAAMGQGGEGSDTPVRVLVVGGNELQARMDGDIRSRVAAGLPGVTVEFLHTGWSGNWTSYVDRFDRMSARADGVVFLQMMRTMLGRTVRARCHLPWRGCRGKGQGEIVNAVKRVAPPARERVAERLNAVGARG